MKHKLRRFLRRGVQVHREIAAVIEQLNTTEGGAEFYFEGLPLPGFADGRGHFFNSMAKKVNRWNP